MSEQRVGDGEREMEDASVSDRLMTERSFELYWIVGAVCWSTVGNSMSPGSAIDVGAL